MKLFVVLALIAAVAVAAPAGPAAGPDASAQVLRSDSEVNPDGYQYAYETSNGISANEQGQLQNAGSENESISVRGQYSYQGPDGVVYTVQYVADENGFQPQGAHLPAAAK